MLLLLKLLKTAFNKKMEENLVGTHPRDALLVLRQDNLEVKKVKERKEALIKARNIYESELKQFMEKFLADENASLPPAQEEELAKIYASRCKKIIGLHLGFWSLFLTIFGSNIYSYGFNHALPLAPFLGMIPVSILHIRDKVAFLRARKILKTATAEELKNLDSIKKNTSPRFALL